MSVAIPSTVSTRFLILSDTHNFTFGDAEQWGGLLKQPMPKCDVLLHAGDLTMTGKVEKYKQFLEQMGKIDAELKLVIAGNHDMDLDREYWNNSNNSGTSYHDGRHEDALAMMVGDFAKSKGVIYLEEGLNTFTLKNGAQFTIYTSPYQPEFCNWGFAYERDEDRFNPPEHVAPRVKYGAKNIIPDFPGVDIIMTHGPPRDILDWTARGNVGCDALATAVSRAKPRLYCFGHIHEAYGATKMSWKEDGEKANGNIIDGRADQMNLFPAPNKAAVDFGRETLMVNASIMSIAYKPVNSPWLVDLELRKKY